jgi:arsenate reductase (thioredoxin)
VSKPSVVFLCVHNAGRSQMAAGLLRSLSRGSVDVLSAGSEPADSINPMAVKVMAERGIDISTGIPAAWTHEMLGSADVIVTMGCGDSCPFIPGKRYVDWELDDPTGRTIAEVRAIRDELELRVRGLMAELGAHPIS